LCVTVLPLLTLILFLTIVLMIVLIVLITSTLLTSPTNKPLKLLPTNPRQVIKLEILHSFFLLLGLPFFFIRSTPLFMLRNGSILLYRSTPKITTNLIALFLVMYVGFLLLSDVVLLVLVLVEALVVWLRDWVVGMGVVVVGGGVDRGGLVVAELLSLLVSLGVLSHYPRDWLLHRVFISLYQLLNSNHPLLHISRRLSNNHRHFLLQRITAPFFPRSHNLRFRKITTINNLLLIYYRRLLIVVNSLLVLVLMVVELLMIVMIIQHLGLVDGLVFF